MHRAVVVEELDIASGKDNKKNRKPSAAPEPTRWEQTDEDVRLMLRFTDGDEAAFEELVRRNAGKVHGIIYRFLGNGALVEDLTQEVFMRVHRTAPRYTPTAKFSTWLYRVTANLCFNVMRSRRKGYARQLDAHDDEDADGFFQSLPDGRHGSPTDALDRAELSEKLHMAISALPESQRMALILNKYENKSYEEISDVLKCSSMAVKSLLSRARQNLRASLEGYLHAE